MMRSRTGFVLLVSLLLLLFVGVVGAQEPVSGGSLTVVFSSEWGVLDPAANTNTFGRNIMQFIYDPLLRKHPTSGAIGPGLAESFSFSDDGTVITLSLRQGVTFHDGTPFNAEAVRFSFERISDPELASPWAAAIVGPVEAIETPDEYTVVMTLKEPFAPYLDSLTQIGLAPVSPAAVAEHGADYGLNPVGTGPFRFVSTSPDEEVVMARNEDYNWAPDYYEHQGPAYLEELIALHAGEDSTRMALVETFEVDVVYSPLASQLPFFQEDPDFYVPTAARTGVPRILVLNTETFPFDDAATRRAVAWAVDRERILNEVFGGIGAVPQAILTPGLFGYWNAGMDQWPGYDLEMAAALLAEAGWGDSDGNGILDKDGQAFSITYGISPGFPFDQYGQIVVNDLTQVGIEITVETEEIGAYLADMRAGKWELAGMLFPATDPDVFNIIAHSSSIDAAWNTARFNNAEVDALIEAGRRTLDLDARAAIYHQIQEIMLNEMPYIPFYVIENAFVVNARVKNFRTNAQGFFDFYDTYVSDE